VPPGAQAPGGGGYLRYRGADLTRARLGSRCPKVVHLCGAQPRDLGLPPHAVRESSVPFDIEVTMTAYARASLEEKRRALVMLGIALG
jgi:hypothetical protein